MKIRLNKFIAQSSEYSRRKADELIKEGKVKVNGKIVALKIVDALKAMGYNVAYGIQDSCGFETPQHRRRTVIIAHKTKEVSLPIPDTGTTMVGRICRNLLQNSSWMLSKR